MAECHYPTRARRAPIFASVLAFVAFIAARFSLPYDDVAFVAAQRVTEVIPCRVALRAAKGGNKDFTDAEIVGQEGSKEGEDDVEEMADDDDIQEESIRQRDLANSGYIDYIEERQAQWPKKRNYGPEAKCDYKYDRDPPDSWFERRTIDRFKVFNVFFDQFKKPKEWFPYDLQPGDTVRVSYLDSKTAANDKGRFEGKHAPTRSQMKEQNFEGVILDFRNKYHLLEMIVRGMKNKGTLAVGVEWTFPLHSPLVTKIQVLKRGYIGQNKNAFFIRGLVGQKNAIPIDKDRTARDVLYNDYRMKKKLDLVPASSYPTEEMYRFPQAVSVQDMPEWDESTYDGSKVDQRSWYEKTVLANFRLRPKQELRGKRRKPNQCIWHR